MKTIFTAGLAGARQNMNSSSNGARPIAIERTLFKSWLRGLAENTLPANITNDEFIPQVMSVYKTSLKKKARLKSAKYVSAVLISAAATYVLFGRFSLLTSVSEATFALLP
ncbi:MAG: hypothetical protein HRT71_13955 [Flavobacteriales bacterium]|nr:hypothetical protein [Flavobacteriales bacterium]